MARCKRCGRHIKYWYKYCGSCYNKINRKSIWEEERKSNKIESKSSSLAYVAVFIILLLAIFLVLNQQPVLKENLVDVKENLKETQEEVTKLVGCQSGFEKIDGNCVKILFCADGTKYGECGKLKPFYCDDGNISSRVDLCGCPEEQVPDKNNCVSVYLTDPKENEFKYTLRGKKDLIEFTVYKGLNDFLAGKQRSYYCEPVCPSKTELELRYLNEGKQEEELNKLVGLIKK